MRIFALSDVHIQQAINRAWVERLSETDYRDDVLILAGELLPVMYSAGLDAQIRRLQPTIHVFGHSHHNVDVACEGIRYVNCALAGC